MNSPLVSVIVPVYNVAPYLEQCLDSLVNQTYRNLEIILVDDGSTDESGTVCDRYADLDSRIQVVHKENGGQSSARNVALDMMTGEWVLFVDSDDWIELNTLELLFEQKDERADLVEFGWNFIYRDSNKVFLNQACVMAGIDALKLLVHTDIYMGLMANKLFKASYLQKSRFISGRYYEDTPFIIEQLYKIKTYQYIAEPLYNYRRDRVGQTTAGFTPKRFDLFLNIDSLIEKYEGTDMVIYLETFYRYWVKNNYFEAYIKPSLGERQYAKALLSPYLTKARRLSNMYIDWKTNLSWRAFYTCPWLYAFLVVHVQPLVKKLISR